MRCDRCDILLDVDDNYCRRCGAPVQIVQPPAVRQAQPPALFRSTAAPLVTGAATVAAAALLRWALVRVARGLLAVDASRRSAPFAGRSVARREPSHPPSQAGAPKQVVEVLWYRRTVRD